MDTSTKLLLLSTSTAGIFSGAAFYINAVEHPARQSCGIEVCYSQWKPSYLRAAKIQASLAIISCLSAIVNRFKYATSNKQLILFGGCLIGSVVPFTLVAIMPTNKTLLANQNLSNEKKEELLTVWGYLHGVRTVASLIAFGLMLYTLAKK